MPKREAGLAAMWMALGIISGALGAHAVSNLTVGPDLLASAARRNVTLPGDYLVQTWKTGAHYHQLQALALVFFAWIAPGDYRGVKRLWWAGSIVFAGTLYLLVLLQKPWLGAITPIGGAMMIGGWIWLGLSPFKKRAP